jgi:ankyrin repeat protein
LHAAYRVGLLACVKVPHEKEAKINVETTLGKTLLHLSIKSNIILLVEYLLKFGARPNVMDNKGLTPLHVAATNKPSRITEILVQ